MLRPTPIEPVPHETARIARAVSGGRGAMGIGQSIVHLHVYTPNLLDTEASYQCRKDFASSIKIAEEPTIKRSRSWRARLNLWTAARPERP
jgi:hypothetical protein